MAFAEEVGKSGQALVKLQCSFIDNADGQIARWTSRFFEGGNQRLVGTGCRLELKDQAMANDFMAFSARAFRLLQAGN